MTLIHYAARELSREVGKRSREFYEFVMPAIDMYEDETGLIVRIDLPGFKREEIKISIEEDLLSIRAKRMESEDERLGTMIYKQRPIQIDKRISLPISVKEGEKVSGIATYLDGVVTLKIPTSRANIIPVT
ncbi:MAG TPA: archaeal heat shock protein Hsp14 [Nitrososphaera sp.]|jgi:HSP20 family protein|nr:archaeal heat shock protein Hsp14 [Nitrososphaera sp.]